MKKILLICLVLIVLGIGMASVSAEDDFDTVITTAGEPDSAVSTDLIPITDPESGEFPITPGFDFKQIMITVESNPSTPFTWIVSNETYGVVLDKEYFVPYNPGSLGGSGTEYFIFNITSDDFYIKVVEISLETKEPTGKYVEKTSKKPLPVEIIPVIIDGDKLILSAKESGSVPYRWEVSNETYGVELINTTYESLNPGVPGSSGVKSFIFKILNPDDYYAKIIEVYAITEEPTGKYVENGSKTAPLPPEIIPVVIDGDKLILSAKEIGGTPYKWEVSSDTYGVELINTTFEPFNPELEGSAGVRSFIFKILNPDDYYAKIIEVSSITKEPTGKYVENSSASVKPVEPVESEEEVQNSSKNQMEPTGLPILALLLALFVIPLGYRKK